MLIDYFNKLYRNNIDIQEIIKAIQPELNDRSLRITKIYNNCFAITSDLEGIQKWENLLNIISDPTLETLQFRRERVVIRLANTIPYTEKTLQQLMDTIIGLGNWSYDLNPVACILSITCLRPGKAWLREMTTVLKDILPANIEFTLYITYNTWDAVNDFTWEHIKTKKWFEVKEEVM